MDIDSDKVNAFYELSKAGTFLKASKNLGMTQPALSKKIARLEESLNTTLLIRGSKQVNLTDTGAELLRYFKAKSFLDQEFLQKIGFTNTENQYSEVRISSYSSIGRSLILPVLHRYQQIHQSRLIRFSIQELGELKTELLSGTSDIVLTSRPIVKKGIQCFPVGTEEFVHVAPIHSKTNLPYLDHDENDQTTIEFLRHQSLPTNVNRHFYSDVYGILDAVRLGLGQAIVSKHLVVSDKKIKTLKSRRRMKIPIYLCYFERAFFPKHLEDLISMLNKALSK